MQLTKHTDFAFRCLMYLGTLPDGQLATISEISTRFTISRNHLMKVVNQLARLGYVASVRGPKGGVRLGRPASDINLGDLVRDFEARLDPVNCDEPVCPIKGACELKRVLNRAQQAFFDVLDQHSLASLLKSPDALIKLVSI